MDTRGRSVACAAHWILAPFLVDEDDTEDYEHGGQVVGEGIGFLHVGILGE